MQVALQFGLCKPRQQHMNLSEVLRAHLELPHAILPGPINYTKVCVSFRCEPCLLSIACTRTMMHLQHAQLGVQ